MAYGVFAVTEIIQEISKHSETFRLKFVKKI